ncbi:MAG: bifunctional riboflavin kinase/FAD synthetase [Bacteroidota bacterium]
MKVYRSLEAYEAGPHSVATIGTFDGVHIGHRTILQRLIESARAIEGESILISFHPHPRLVLFPENNPLRLLHTLDEKIALLDEIGLDKLLLIPFTREFSRLSSKAFIRDVLVDTVQIQKIIIGYDHHFGKNRTGGIEELQEYAPLWKYEVEEIPAQSIDDAKVSSTQIRNALKGGDVRTAAKYLGYHYSFAGEVVHGEKQGRLLGFPTANIQPENERKLIPANGVYFARVTLPSGERKFGLISIGVKPTMGEFQRSQEVWIYDFEGDLYGQHIRVEMLEWLRGEEKFDGLEALIAQMNLDKAKGYTLMEQNW